MFYVSSERTRSHSGCKSCRRRKVKCDEKKPICGACNRRGVDCVFPQINIVQVLPGEQRSVRKRNCSQRSKKPQNTRALIENSQENNTTTVPNTLQSLQHGTPSPEPIESFFDVGRFIQEMCISARDLDPLVDLTPEALFDHFVRFSSQRLVALPFDENPFAILLPRLASKSTSFYNLILAYSASHKALLLGLTDTPTTRALVDSCHYAMANSTDFTVDGALLFAALLSQLEADRGNLKQWQICAMQAIKMIKTRAQSRELSEYTEAHDAASMLKMIALKMVGSDIAIGNIDEDSPLDFLRDLSFWPRWSHSQGDVITGFDPNSVPVFAEVAELIHLTRAVGLSHAILTRGLRVIMRLNDGIFEDTCMNEISVLSKLYQLSFKVHVYRRVLRFRSPHPHVRRIVSYMLDLIDRGIPESSLIHTRMPFVISTLCCECDPADNWRRASLKRRLEAMDSDGFVLNRSIRETLEQNWDDLSGLLDDFASTAENLH